jgi:hypothetical protein
MYSAVLTAHSWLRWVVLLTCVYAIVRAIGGASARRPWGAADGRAGTWLLAAVDLQFLLGVLLYFVLSPFTTAALDDFGEAMRTSRLRFWAVEHLFGMVVGTALVHVGRVRVRRTADAVRKHRVAAVFFTLALIAFVAAVPWPGTPNGRALFRMWP